MLFEYAYIELMLNPKQIIGIMRQFTRHFFFNGQISGKLFLVVRVMCFFFLNNRWYTLINTLRKQFRNVNVFISLKILSCLPELWIVCSRYQLLDTWASRLGNHAIVKLYYNPEERHQLIQNNKIRLKNTTFSLHHLVYVNALYTK